MDIDLVLAALSKIANSAPPALLFFGLIGFGYVLKVISIFPNSKIPLANLITALIIYPVIAHVHPHLEETYSMRWPLLGAFVRDEIVAIVIFSASWLMHRWGLRRWIDPKLFKNDTPLTPAVDSGTKPP